MDEAQEATASTSIDDRLRLNRTQLVKKKTNHQKPTKPNPSQCENFSFFKRTGKTKAYQA